MRTATKINRINRAFIHPTLKILKVFKINIDNSGIYLSRLLYYLIVKFYRSVSNLVLSGANHSYFKHKVKKRKNYLYKYIGQKEVQS